MKLSLRVTFLIHLWSETVCSFTVPSYPFHAIPTKGDNIIVGDTLCDDFYLTVSRCVHYREPISVLVLAEPYVFSDYDDLLRVLDYFKDQFEIKDLAAPKKPVSYYVLYRRLLNLFGWTQDTVPDLSNDSQIKAIAESCRAILIAEDLCASGLFCEEISSRHVDESFGLYQNDIIEFHNIIINKNQDSGTTGIFEIIREWEQHTNKTKCEWVAPECYYERVGRYIFQRVHSVPEDMLPVFLRKD